MRQQVDATDMVELMLDVDRDVAGAMTGATRDGTEALKEDWRDEIRRLGLGERLARTVRGRTYPQAGDSLDPATWVWTKAPQIIDGLDRGATIRPVNGSSMLALPTLNVPKRGRRTLTPVEVEALYDQDLTIRRGRRGTLLAFVDAQGGVAQWTRAQGRAYGSKGALVGYKTRPRRLGRPIWKLMFVLVRQTKLRARPHVDAVAARAQARFPSLLDRRWALIPDRTAPMKRL